MYQHQVLVLQLHANIDVLNDMVREHEDAI